VIAGTQAKDKSYASDMRLIADEEPEKRIDFLTFFKVELVL